MIDKQKFIQTEGIRVIDIFSLLPPPSSDPPRHPVAEGGQVVEEGDGVQEGEAQEEPRVAPDLGHHAVHMLHVLPCTHCSPEGTKKACVEFHYFSNLKNVFKT